VSGADESGVKYTEEKEEELLKTTAIHSTPPKWTLSINPISVILATIIIMVSGAAEQTKTKAE
jgi:hypothetical protein